MSTNPFRQIRTRQEQTDSNTSPPLDSQRVTSDGSGSRTSDLSVDTKVPPSSLARHVSFASPPVDNTISAASYPSSPESTRSPPLQTSLPVNPNYWTALQDDPFRGLGHHGGEDYTIQAALNNAQTNAATSQGTNTTSHESTVRDTLSRFAAVPQPAQEPIEQIPPQPPSATRQSLDVEAFKRLLLTGDSGRSTPGTSTPPVPRLPTNLDDISIQIDTTSLEQQSISDAGVRDLGDTPRSSYDQDRGSSTINEKHKNPPPAPAPRRGKSVKVKPALPPPQRELSQSGHSSIIQAPDKLPKKPPTPPLARRRSQKTPSIRSEEDIVLHPEASSPNEPPQTNPRPPPPPPSVRRQHVLSQQRSVSNELGATIEESEPEIALSLSAGSTRSSNDRPLPPLSRNSSASMKRQSLVLMQPPPLPPPRKGRGSSRSSVDSYRPSLASIMGDEGGQGDEFVISDSRRASSKDQKNLASPSADSILAELANLQREVDAARRGA